MIDLKPINKWLADHYGLFDGVNQRWRVCWSNDEFETRFGEYTDRTPEGFLIRTVSEWRKVPKYDYIPNQYVLEQIIPVPEGSDIDTKLSYEPLWSFSHDDKGNPIPPKLEILQLIISTVNNNLAKQMGKIETPFLEQQTPEAIKARVDLMEEALFGNESRVGSSLAIGEGVSLSGAYNKGIH